MKRVALVLTLAAIVAGCGPSAEYEACVERGIRYYKEIDSWPTLQTSGEKAEMVVKRHCQRSYSAF